MVERAEGLPAGVLGFRLSGKLSRGEYQHELIQPISAALERGEQLNLYFVFADDFSGSMPAPSGRTSSRSVRSASSIAPPGGGWRS